MHTILRLFKASDFYDGRAVSEYRSPRALVRDLSRFVNPGHLPQPGQAAISNALDELLVSFPMAKSSKDTWPDPIGF